MGQMLDKPITAKESEWGPQTGALGLSFAASCMQGWRMSMEDAHVCMPALPCPALRGVALFGVFDGHGGEQVAKFCARHLPEEMCAMKFSDPPTGEEVGQALHDAFHRMDEMLREPATMVELKSLSNPPSDPTRSPRPSTPHVCDPHTVGCTANVVCVTPTQIITANAGDSRSVLCRKGEAVPLSQDHKPNDPTERRRIEAAGGYVENSAPGVWRVNGNLNLSRALGDLEYKRDRVRPWEEQIISGTPDISVLERHPEEDEFIVVCCDGVWDVKTNQQVVNFVRERLPVAPQAPDQQGVAEALEGLLDACISPNLRATRGLGGDNMTAVVVRFPQMMSPPSSPPSAAVEPAEERLGAVGVQQGRAELLPQSAKASLPRLGNCKLSDESRDGEAGSLTIRLQLPPSWTLDGLSLRVNDVISALEVGYDAAGSAGSGDDAPRIFDLGEFLPPGAVLTQAEESLNSAQLIRKSHTLRIHLPWRMQ